VPDKIYRHTRREERAIWYPLGKNKNVQGHSVIAPALPKNLHPCKSLYAKKSVQDIAQKLASYSVGICNRKRALDNSSCITLTFTSM
jgi:hypothetical protein